MMPISAGIKKKSAIDVVRRVTKANQCRSKRKTSFQNSNKFGNTHRLLETSEETEEECEEYAMFHLAAKEREPYRVDLQLNGVQTSMEVDTGAAATIINEETYKRIIDGNSAKNRPQMGTAKVRLRTYTGELVKV